MSWIAKLYETYESSFSLDGVHPWPLAHFVKNAHIEVVIDGVGNYKEGRLKLLIGDDSPTLIPATESSVGRSGSKIAPHPLCDELGYCATDLPGRKKEKTDAYILQLVSWCNSAFAHPKVQAVCDYLKKGSLWKDISNEVDFPITFKNKSGQSTKLAPEKVFIRWRIEILGDPCSGTWEDESLIAKWIDFDELFTSTSGFCFVTGDECRSARNHPRCIRHAGDGAKLISSNDTSGFTFRGKFIESAQSAEIGFVVTQKAHNALRWLISRQGFRNGDQVIVAWAVSGAKIPDPMVDTKTIFDWDDLDEIDSTELDETPNDIDHGRDLGQSYALKLNKKMAGYRAYLGDFENIIIMAVDSATPGRMGIPYYRECFAKDFFEKLESWHQDFAWQQRPTKELPQANSKKAKTKVVWPISTPAPYIIADAVYGKTVTDSLKKNLYERLMPCILEGRAFPVDIVNNCIRRASNPNSGEHWEWERNVAVACSLYRGFYRRHPIQTKRRDYSMSLEINNTSRDYLYGRLLAVAERIEQIALSVANEKRMTTAERLMQRFADRPYSTWRTIELALKPYMQRLQSSRAGFLNNQQKILDEIMDSFIGEEFSNDKKLSGEFLLSYHCQRQYFRNKAESENSDS